VSVILDDALSQYLYINEVIGGTEPFTVAGWYKTDDLTVNKAIWSLALDSVDTEYFTLLLRSAAGGGFVTTAIADTGQSVVYVNTTTTYTSNIWQHAAAVYTSNSSRDVYLNGSYKGTSAASLYVGASRTSIGCLYRSSICNYFSGKLAGIAIWDIALSEDELVQLAGGIEPIGIQPEHILAYWPLIIDGNDESGNGKHLTGCNSPTFDEEDTPSYTPEITNQSEDQNLDPGDTLELFVTASGTEPLLYQWSKAYEGGGDIEGATESTYTKENVTGDDGGGYYCTVTNEYGTVKSSTIDINVYPGIIDQSENMEVYEGSGISLFVEGTAYPEPTYQWYEGGVEEEDKIEGATESTLEFVAREGTFYCKVTSEDVSEDFSSVQALGGYEDTPIIPVGGVDESDRFMTEIGNILYEPNEDSRKYKQFYTGYNSGPSTDEKVHYAYSEDGVNWTKSSFNPVISDRAEDPYVLKVGSIYYLFAEDKQGGATDIKRWHSSDCETWVDDGVVLENEGVDWESHDVSSPIVWMEESIWYMLYEGRKLNGSLIGKMGLATSEDGLNWTKYGSNPVFVGSGVNGDFDKNQVVPDDIVKIEDTYYLTYHGHDGVEWRCGIATSPDLINWTRIGTPIQFYGEDSTPIMVYWDGNRYIFHIDTDTEGTYRGWIITGWLYGEVWSDPITVTIAVISGLYVYNPFDLPLDLGRTD